MGNIQGQFDVGSFYNITAAAPLDVRTLVKTELDLIAEDSWNKKTHPPYKGMMVTVQETGNVYILIDVDNVHSIDGWKKLGSDLDSSPFEKGSAENSAVLKGGNNIASSSNSSAFGLETEANGKYSHAEGFTTITYNEAEHASGRYNNSVEKTESNTNADATLFSIGIGDSKKQRKNAFEVKQNGDIYIEGVEGRIQDKLKEMSIAVATQAEIDALFTKGSNNGSTSY